MTHELLRVGLEGLLSSARESALWTSVEAELCDVGAVCLRLNDPYCLKAKAALSLCKEVHSLPEDVRSRASVVRSRGNRGFFEVSEGSNENHPERQRRRYGSFEFGASEASTDTAIESILRAPNQFPDVPEVAQRVRDTIDFLQALSLEVAKAISLGLKQSPDFLVKAADHSCSQGRLLDYPESDRSREKSTLGAHTDYEVFTLIFQSSPGLAVLSPSRGWIKPIPDTTEAILLIGDMGMLLANGAFSSCIHRVDPEGSSRQSVVFFFGLNSTYVVKPLGAFGAPRFQPVVFGEHLAARAIANYPHIAAYASTLLDRPWQSQSRNVMREIRMAQVPTHLKATL